MMTGSLKIKKINKKRKNKKKKGGCSVIRACSLIRSNTVSHITHMVILDSGYKPTLRRVC